MAALIVISIWSENSNGYTCYHARRFFKELQHHLLLEKYLLKRSNNPPPNGCNIKSFIIES